MVNVAIVGHEYMSPTGADGLISILVKSAEGKEDTHFCYVEHFDKDLGDIPLDERVSTMLASNPDALHFEDIRYDYDVAYIRKVRERAPNLPILLVSARPIKKEADSLGIGFLEKMFDREKYVSTVKELIRNFPFEQIGNAARGFRLYHPDGAGFGTVLTHVMIGLEYFLCGEKTLAQAMSEIKLDAEWLDSAYNIPEQIRQNPGLFSLNCVCEETRAHIELVKMGLNYLNRDNDIDKKKTVASILVSAIVGMTRLTSAHGLFMARFKAEYLPKAMYPEFVREKASWPLTSDRDILTLQKEISGYVSQYIRETWNKFDSLPRTKSERDEMGRKMQIEIDSFPEDTALLVYRMPEDKKRTVLRLFYSFALGGIEGYVAEINNLFRKTRENPVEAEMLTRSVIVPDLLEAIPGMLINYSSAIALRIKYEKALEEVFLQK